MTTNLPQHALDTLAAEAAVIRAGEKVRDTGGAESACVEYDELQKVENEIYEAMNKKGLTRPQWKEFDRVRRDLYRNSRI